MARGAGEPSAKRAKVDEADEEEDPLVRRKEEVVRLLKEARSREDARAERVAKKELLTLCADFEAKNEEHFRRLLPELWQKIVDENVQQNDLLALAMTCRFFREKQKDLGKKVETDLNYGSLRRLKNSGKVTSHTLGWFQWVCDTLEILPGYKYDLDERVKGAMYEGDLVNYAAFQGSVEILRWLVEDKGWELNVETDRWAGRGGSVEVLEYLNFITTRGLLEYLGGEGYEFTKAACHGAAIGGSLKALKFLRGLEPPCPWDVNTCSHAAYGGHLEALKWARSQDPPCPWNEMTCADAARGGHLEVLKWARSEDPPCPWDEMTCNGAAHEGQLEVLKWVRDQDPPCPWDERTCREAAQEGHLEVLKFLRAQKPPCPWDEGTCQWAARNGHLEVLKWVRSQDPPCPWGASTCAYAAFGGRHDVLKWLRAQQPPCPWNWMTCAGAAQGGQLEVLKWARSQGPPCPWDLWTCTWAAKEGHLEVLKWARDQDPPCPWNENACAFAASEGHLEILKFARGQDPPCPWDEGTCSEAATGGQLEVLKWLRSQDPPCPWHRRHCREEASLNGHQHVIDWIDQREDESDVEYRELSESDGDESL
ncbi:putative ankyrin repeat protein [Chloropicon roscoffensis]|uniref:Ankyrin repeat protein n=1 Tax=Chloropicon roscoffensis TaxID=1461544 RepID=A0AAX4PI17_9CHLO